MNLPLSRTRWDRRWLELFEERAAIIEFMGNLPRDVAEFRAEQDIRKLAAREKREERTA